MKVHSVNPLVSVVVPCFNQGVYLEEAINSVLIQTYTNWECVIVNDGSTDDTSIVAQKLQSRDKRIKLIEKSNGGLSDARNAGVLQSSGSLILPLDADDRIHAEYLLLAVREFESDPSVSLIYSLAEFFGSKTGAWNVRYKGYENLLMSNTIFCSAVYRRSDFDRIGGYDVAMRNGFEDWEFWLRLLSPGAKVVQLSKVLFFYRKKSDSMIVSLLKSKQVEGESINYIVCKHMVTYTTHFGGLSHIIREHHRFSHDQKEMRANPFSKILLYMARKIAGLP
jgi:glycosyltransferase involved in cell wall biosynthesis